MLLTVSKRLEFSASRRLFVRRWTDSENLIAFGPETAARYGTGRNYVAYFVFAGPVNPTNGMLINISEMKERAGGIVHNHETEFEAAERRIRNIRRCGAAKLATMEQSYLELLEAIGEDPQREGLQRTPNRAARALEFLTNGYRQNLDDVVNNAIYESDASEIILVKNIELYSLCEHHLLPFIGQAHVAYIPQGKVIGLSKVARIVDVFARRLQIQENLTTQIADALMKCLEPNGAAVVIEAKHLCMMMRGVEKQNSVMKTSCLLGSFKEDARTRSEFLALLA